MVSRYQVRNGSLSIPWLAMPLAKCMMSVLSLRDMLWFQQTFLDIHFRYMPRSRLDKSNVAQKGWTCNASGRWPKRPYPSTEDWMYFTSYDWCGEVQFYLLVTVKNHGLEERRACSVCLCGMDGLLLFPACHPLVLWF